jgi:hypothetical protein
MYEKKDGGKMKIKKKALSILLVMSLIISSLVPSMVFADAPDNSAAIIRLQQLGIVDSSITDVNSLLTRAQLAKAIAVAKDLTDEAATLSGSTIFPDVESYSELSGYVNALISRGLMYGRPDGYFHPESGVSYSEACIILVKLLGYTDSDVTGMWPNNYISKATDLKLNDKITLKKNDNITVGVAAIMLDRLLDTNMKKASASEADKTFSEYVSLYTDIVVYDNSLTYSSLAANAVLTDKGTYYLSDANAKLQAGNTFRVTLDDNNITKVYGKINENFSLTVDTFIDSTVNYKENNISKSMTLPSDVNYYYHGVKQNYSSLNDILKTNTTLAFAYNNNKTGYEYAVVVDPIYSKPQVAISFNPNSDNIGDIVFGGYATIIKNGKAISKTDIEEMDVVYSVTDINGNNRCIFVYDDKAEGSLKEFSPNGPAPTAVQIDNSKVNFSKDMNLSSVSQVKVGDKVAALLGYDGKAVDIRKITYKTGTKIEAKILGNSKTSDNLNDSQVLTDSGKYNVLSSVGTLEIGLKYTVNVDENTIVKAEKLNNSLETYGVRRVSDNIVYYGTGQDLDSFELPKASTYYYHAEKTDYETVLSKLKLGSSVILAKNNDNYDYGVIIDPVYSNPTIKTFYNREDYETMYNDGAMFIYRKGKYSYNPYAIEIGDVVYEVSDLWGSHKYVYVLDNEVDGEVAKISPNIINPESIQIGNVTYSFSKYFDISKLNDVEDESYVTLSLDKDGKVIDIYVY